MEADIKFHKDEGDRLMAESERLAREAHERRLLARRFELKAIAAWAKAETLEIMERANASV